MNLIHTIKKGVLLFSISAFVFISCNKDDGTTPSDDTTPSISLPVPEMYKRIYAAGSITNDGTWIAIKTNGVPDHKSPYFESGNILYEVYSGTTFTGTNFVKNPNTIATQNYTFKIPVNPAVSSSHPATALGAIGVALNGVPLYNQYAGPNNQVLTNEIASFDRYYGHPAQAGRYHYHVEPLYLTTEKFNKSALLGFLLDGFPVYGPEEENGTTVTMLDGYHGHSHVTADYPNGIYHYHFTDEAPYLNGNGYYGTPGTVTQ